MRIQRTSIGAPNSIDGKAGEVGERGRGVSDCTPHPATPLMRQLREFVEHAELVEDLQSRGMDGVAAEIAKEIGVFLEAFPAYPRSAQQQPENQARRSA